MEDLVAKALGVLIDKGGLPYVLMVLFAGLWLLERRAHNKTTDERIADLKQLIPLMDASTGATQAAATSDAAVVESVRRLGELIAELKTLLQLAIAKGGR